MTDQKITWLECSKCGFKHEPGTATKPICPDCGATMNIHSDQKKTEAELEFSFNATLNYMISGAPWKHSSASCRQDIRAFINHLKSTRREEKRRAFEAGKTGVVVGKWDEANGEYRLEDQETYKTFEQWESEQEKGK